MSSHPRYTQNSGFYGSKQYDGHEWNANFTHMLSRTRENINRIYSRYDAENAEIRNIESMSSPVRHPKSSYGHSSSLYDDEKQFQRPITPTRDRIEASSSARTFQDMLLARVAKLEQQGLTNTSSEYSNERLSKLEDTVRSLSKSVEELTAVTREQHSNMMKITHQYHSHTTAIDILQHDSDTRRGIVSKLDTWVRGSEQWRDDMESRLEDFSKQLKVNERNVNAGKSTASEFVTKMDLSEFKNHIHATTQQSVVASLTAWHDKIENNVRMLERQMAALRIGASSDVTLTDEQVKQAFLSSSQPSELLVRGVVSTELRSLESSLEDKIHARALAAVKSEFYEHLKEMKAEAKAFVQQLAPQEDASNTSDKRKTLTADHSNLSDRVDDLSHALITLQDALNASQKNYSTELHAMERRVDACSTVVDSYSVMAQQHRSEISSVLLMSEERAATKTSQVRDELSSQLHELNEKCGVDRVASERRLTLMERMVADLVEKVELSKNLIESYLVTSPEIIKLQTMSQAASSKLESLTSDVSSMKTIFADHQSTVSSRLERVSSRKEEVTELRERLVLVEQVAGGVPELNRNISKLESEVQSLQSKCKELQTHGETSRDTLRDTSHIIDGINNRLQSAVKSISSLEESITKQFDTQLRREADGIKTSIEKIQMQVQHLVQQTHNGEMLCQSLKGNIAQCQKDFDSLSTEHAALVTDTQQISRDLAKLQFNVEKSSSNADNAARHASFVDRRLDAAEVRLGALEQSLKPPARRNTMYYDVEDDGDENETKKPQRRQTAYFEPDVEDGDKNHEEEPVETNATSIPITSSVPFSTSTVKSRGRALDATQSMAQGAIPSIDSASETPENRSEHSKESFSSAPSVSDDEVDLSSHSDSISHADDMSKGKKDRQDDAINNIDDEPSSLFDDDEPVLHDESMEQKDISHISTAEEVPADEASDASSFADDDIPVLQDESMEQKDISHISTAEEVPADEASDASSFADDDIPVLQDESMEQQDISNVSAVEDEASHENDAQHVYNNVAESVDVTYYSVGDENNTFNDISDYVEPTSQVTPSAKSETSHMFDVDSTSDWDDEESDAEVSAEISKDDEITPEDDALMSADFAEEKTSAFITSTGSDNGADDQHVSEVETKEDSPATEETPLSFREKLRQRQEQLRNAEVQQTPVKTIVDESESDFSASIDDDDDSIMHDISDASSSDEDEVQPSTVPTPPVLNNQISRNNDDAELAPPAAAAAFKPQSMRNNDFSDSEEEDEHAPTSFAPPSRNAPNAAPSTSIATVSRFGERDLLNNDESDYDEDGEAVIEDNLIMSLDDSFY